MNLFETILLNIIFIIFPLTFCLLYQSYNKTLNKEKNDLFLDCAIFSSFYLIIRFGTRSYIQAPVLIFNIPLLIAYMKDRKLCVVLMSTLSIIYYHFYLKFPLSYLIIEYCLYYGIYLFYIIKNKDKHNFINIIVLLKSLLLTVFIEIAFNYRYDLNDIISYLIIVLSFYIITKFTIYLFERAEDILALHNKIKEFEKEKQIRESLFKITHEIKNPIAVCKGYLDMYDVDNLEHSRKYIPILKEEITRVLLLLQDFLSINRIKIEKEIMDINLLLENLEKNFKPILEDKNIKTKFEVSEDELFINGDYNRISQVLINIVKNSIEAIPDNKEGQIDVSVEESKNQIKIKIKDNGIGMTKEELSKIKEPFFTTKYKGTGLGIYLSDEIIRGHSGNIQYSSKENEGTIVTVTLPKNIKTISHI